MESAPPHVRNLGRIDDDDCWLLSLLMPLLMLLLAVDEGWRIQSLLLFVVELIGPCNSSGEGRLSNVDCCCDDDGADRCCCCCCICCCCCAAWIDCNEGNEDLVEVLSGDS